jgi:hypothetical protein
MRLSLIICGNTTPGEWRPVIAFNTDDITADFEDPHFGE